MSQTNLVITALGSDRSGIVKDLSSLIANHGANIQDSRMTVLGGEFAIIMMVSGPEENIQELEKKLPSEVEALNLTTIIKRTSGRETCHDTIAYVTEIIAIDNPGIVSDITGFFSNRSINIDDLTTGTYAAPHTGTQMFNLTMRVNIPSSQSIAQLKDDFIQFCDDRNLDAIIEPLR
ncbi:glycine cleavage system protein R [Litoribrevibacter euphylliae]|uniref:Glycine cleavage system transcriptional repressor n=1 Tax=Litoribrevibacter euphylliae TaxID=1834034 RepID=A0ABV7HDL0_9GAMM